MSQYVQLIESVFPFKTLYSNISIKSSHIEWENTTILNPSKPIPTLPVVTGLPHPLKKDWHKPIDYRAVLSYSRTELQVNLRFQSYFKSESTTKATSPPAMSLSPGKFLYPSTSTIPTLEAPPFPCTARNALHHHTSLHVHQPTYL